MTVQTQQQHVDSRNLSAGVGLLILIAMLKKHPLKSAQIISRGRTFCAYSVGLTLVVLLYVHKACLKEGTLQGE